MHEITVNNNFDKNQNSFLRPEIESNKVPTNYHICDISFIIMEFNNLVDQSFSTPT